MIGALPSQHIRRLVQEQKIKGLIKEDSIQPASMDLTISNKAYRISGMFLPKKGESVQELLKHILVYEQDLDKQPIIEKDVVYLIELNQELDLPENIYAYCNNKSSTGRLNLHTKVICDNTDSFDKIPKGYRGKLYLLVVSNSFLIGLTKGDSLNQIRFYNGDSRLNDHELVATHQQNPFVYGKDGKKIELNTYRGLITGIDLTTNPVGWRAKTNNNPIFLNKIGYYKPEDYFEKIHTINDHLILNEGEFYIFCTKEKISIPKEYSAEMVAFDAGIGEFRTHDAGFFDPGFGYGDGTIKGTSGVLEVRPYGNNIVIRDGQPICRFIVDRVTEVPDKIYGVQLKSNYQEQQGPMLSKHFKQL